MTFSLIFASLMVFKTENVRMSSMVLWKMLAAFLKPKESLFNSYFPPFTEKDVFSRSFSAKTIW